MLFLGCLQDISCVFFFLFFLLFFLSKQRNHDVYLNNMTTYHWCVIHGFVTLRHHNITEIQNDSISFRIRKEKDKENTSTDLDIQRPYIEWGETNNHRLGHFFFTNPAPSPLELFCSVAPGPSNCRLPDWLSLNLFLIYIYASNALIKRNPYNF